MTYVLNVDTGYILLPRPFARNARSRVCGEQDGLTKLPTDSGDTCRERGPQKVRLQQSRFSIGSAPLTSITESDAQISGGETRQDYKDTRCFPLAAPSCALLFLPFGLLVSFRCYGRGFSFHA
ncbi:plasmid replication initiation protein [Enterobacter sp. 63]